MQISEHDLNHLIKLSQLLLMEEGKSDIKNIGHSLLEILYHIKDDPGWRVKRVI